MRGDLSDGYKAVQSTHAAINFTFEHPSRAGPWYRDSNYLVILEVPDQTQLEKLVEDCRKQTLAYTVFREPDIGNEATAVAIEPSPLTQRLVAKLPLLFKSRQNEQHKNAGHESKIGQSHTQNSIQETLTSSI